MVSVKLPYVVGTAVTTAILFCGINTSEELSTTSHISMDNPEKIDHGVASSFDRYKLLPVNNIKEKENIEVIHSFASKLLENIEDIPPEFSEAVDANFWDLI